MAYTPPANNAVTFEHGEYTPPSGDSVIFSPTAASGDLVSYVRQPYSIGYETVSGFINQTYSFPPVLVAANYQPYGLSDPILGFTSQPYYQTISSYVSQPYGDVPQLVGACHQYYGVAIEVVSSCRQPYGKAEELVSFVKQPYAIKGGLMGVSKQPYIMTTGPVLGSVSQPYQLEDNNPVLGFVSQSYGLYDAIEPVDLEGSVTWVSPDDQVETLTCITVSLSYSTSQYCGTMNITTSNYNAWLNMNILDPIIFTYGGTSYHFLVKKLIEMESGSTQFTYGIEAKSRAILLDFPYAKQIADDSLLPGNASELVVALAALEGESISWNLDVDPYLTENEVSLAGDSPKDAIRNIANAYGGYIKSMPDGSISVEKSFLYDTDKYYEPDVSIATVISSGTDVAQYQSYTDDREGYNKFSLDSSETSTGYTLESTEVSSTKKHVKAYKVPWDSATVDLITSESTNISINFLGEVEELITEERIEIVEGSGSVSKPVYGTVTPNYNDSANLGAITATEDGTISTAIAENTLVDLSYYTKYWLWEVIDTDVESAQLILVTE